MISRSNRSALSFSLCMGAALACVSTPPPEPTAPEAPHGMDAESVMNGQAWIEFCARIEAAGLQILGDEFPGSESERADGLRHLARTVAMALQWEVDFADPDFPAFYRHNDDVSKWGGPNVDNTYLRARIDGTKTYRLSGDVSTIHDLIVSTSNGDMHDGVFDVAGDLAAADLGIDETGRFEMMIGPDVDAETGIRTPPDHVRLEVRQYFNDWAEESPGVFHLERVSAGPDVPEAITPAVMAERLDRAAIWVERTIPYWANWMGERAAMGPANALGPPLSVPGGSSDIFYGGGRFELEADEALLIELEPPDARYWSLQWYTPSWFESPDFANRQSSLNGAQTHVDSDGRVRIVLSSRDPGIQNWIDVAGHRRGMITYRWIWSNTQPAPTAKVVALDELREHLPGDTPIFGDAERRRQIEVRRRHVERRFRR